MTDKPPYYAKGKMVFKAPIYTPTPEGGQRIEMGFPIFTIHKCVENPEEAARELAEALCKMEPTS